MWTGIIAGAIGIVSMVLGYILKGKRVKSETEKLTDHIQQEKDSIDKMLSSQDFTDAAFHSRRLIDDILMLKKRKDSKRK